MGKFGDFLMNTATQGIGGIMGIALGGLNDARQLRQQEELQRLQIAGNKELMDYSMAKQLQMWRDTNYGPQMEEMKKAGVNPALLYGMKGGGGVTTGSPGGAVTGATATQGGAGELAMGIQLAMMQAQIEKTKAETKNIEADTTNKPLQGANIQASTESLTQGVENQKAQEALTKIQTNIAQIEEHIKGENQNDAVAIVRYTMNQAYSQMKMLQNEKLISDATVQAKIDIVKREAIGMLLKNTLTSAETANVQQDTKNKIQELINDREKFSVMVGELMMAWNRDGRDAARLILQQNTNMNEEEYNPILKVLDGIMPVLPVPGNKTSTPVRGFHNR